MKKDNARIDLIFSSDYLRTRQTTDIVAKKLKIKDIQFDKRLRDINIGVLHGKHISAYKKFFNDESQRFKITPDNGESWNDVRNRVKEFIEEIDKKYKDKNILIVSHGDPLWFLAGVLNGFQTDEQYLNVRYKKLYPQTGQVIKI
ncbi:histidine phosphatase family protein [Patescibacteria group bacterium]|nr:histidine phosphatase family protein [Patescibacteria group bacterium]